MASIVNRGSRFCVVYQYLEANGQKKQKWEMARKAMSFHRGTRQAITREKARK